MSELLLKKTKNGYVRRELVEDPIKVRKLEGLTADKLKRLIVCILSGNFIGMQEFRSFTTNDLGMVLKYSNIASSKKTLGDGDKFTVTTGSLKFADSKVICDYVEDTMKKGQQRVIFSHGLQVKPNEKVPSGNALAARIASAQVGFKKSPNSQDVEIVQPSGVSKSLKTVVPSNTVLSVVMASFQGDATSTDDLREKVCKVLDEDKSYAENFKTQVVETAPKLLKVVEHHGFLALPKNQQLQYTKFTDKKGEFRLKASSLKQLVGTSKHGIGYHALSHYDGISRSKRERKIMDVVTDFDHGTKCDIMRLEVADMRIARAVYNTWKCLQRKDLLVVYEGSSASDIKNYWHDGKIIKSGVVPYPLAMFDRVFQEHFGRVYSYTPKPISITNATTASTYYQANQDLRQYVSHKSHYGGFCMASNLSSLILDSEIADLNKIRKEQIVKDDIYDGHFAPSCRVREGIYLITSTGTMTIPEVFKNVVNGLLHAATWVYRRNPFNAESDPGDTHYAAQVPVFDWMTGTTKTGVKNAVVDDLKNFFADDPAMLKSLDELGLKQAVTACPPDAQKKVQEDEEGEEKEENLEGIDELGMEED